MSNHKHHIVPKYKCEELGLTTSYKIDGIEFYFKENMVEVPREQHALIHWGYKCNDLKPLLEVCNPPQWVIDMIPLGDNRDVGAAAIIALGEIEQIDMSGENNPSYKHGKAIGLRNNPKLRCDYQKQYAQTPEGKLVGKRSSKTQCIKNKVETGYVRGYSRANPLSNYTKRELLSNMTPQELKEHNRVINQRSRDRLKEKTGYSHGHSRAKNKTNTQGQGTLNQFLG